MQPKREGNLLNGDIQGRPRVVAWLLLFSSLQAACTTVQVTAREHDVKVERHWGVLQIQLGAPSALVVSQISGVGLVKTPGAVTLGYVRQRLAALDPACRVVLWIDEAAALDEAMFNKLRTVAGVCMLEPVHSQSPKETQR